MTGRTMRLGVPAVGLALAVSFLAPPAQATVVSELTYDVGCSASTLGRAASVTTTPPTDVRIYIGDAATGLVPGHRYSYVWPGIPDPNGEAVLGRADARGLLYADHVPVELAEPLVDASPKPFELHDDTAGGATVFTGTAAFRPRDGSECSFLGTLTAGTPDPSGLRYFRLAQQSDGNVVERNGQNRALWNSGTAGHPGSHTMIQQDGNLVIRDAAGHPIWNTGTAGHPRATLTLQTDSNLVVRDQLGHALWSSGIHR